MQSSLFRIVVPWTIWKVIVVFQCIDSFQQKFSEMIQRDGFFFIIIIIIIVVVVVVVVIVIVILTPGTVTKVVFQGRSKFVCFVNAIKACFKFFRCELFEMKVFEHLLVVDWTLRYYTFVDGRIPPLLKYERRSPSIPMTLTLLNRP